MSLLLGGNIDNKKKVYIPEEIRSTHMQVIGSTGTGKSKFIEWMIREDIRAGKGVCLIDPHGYLYDDLVNWLASSPEYYDQKKIVLFNPANDDYFLGFNPFIHHSLDISHQVDTMVNACAKAWGAESMDATPLLKKCLRCIFHALAETDLTLIESMFFISLSGDAYKLRKYLTEKIKNPVIKEIWQSFMALKPREYNEQFSSSANRIIEFLSSDRIRRIIGQKQSISFKKMMDEGNIVLVNLSSGQRLSRDNARLLGTLMINDLFLSATERKKQKGMPPKPFYLYIDECAQFLNEDIGRILDECRKFGLHLILAHQHLAQLRKAGDDIYSSIMTDAKTKVIFGGLTPEDAEILTQQIYMGEFNIKEIKHTMYSHQTVGHHREWFHSESERVGSSDTDTESWSETEGTSFTRGSSSGESTTTSLNSSFFSEEGSLSYNTSESISTATNSSSSWGGSQAHSDSYSVTSGKSEGLVPELEEKASSVQFTPLQEQLYRAMALMVNQPQAHCLIKMPEKNVQAIKVPMVIEGDAVYNVRKDLLLEYQIKNFDKYKNDFISLKDSVDKEIDHRQAELLKLAKKHQERSLKKKQGSVNDLVE